MKLILMRHALAEERSESPGDDGSRRLTREGEKKHRDVSEALRRMGIEFEELVSSPLVRARQTAEITAQVYGRAGEISQSDVLGPGFSVAAALRFLEGFAQRSSVLWVGHEPDLSTLSARLLHASGQVHVEFKKSGVLGLDFPEGPKPGSGVLLYFLRPGHLARLARA